MSGEPDSLYTAARQALLDALEAISDHLDAVVLVGAQAVYIHTGAGEIAVAPFTTDADLAIDPSRLQAEPLLEELLSGAGFNRSPNPGQWGKQLLVDGVSRLVEVDLLVPESMGNAPGRRGARIPPHHNAAARQVVGLEATLVDHDPRTIRSLADDDDRKFDVLVAGPSALLVAKIFKIGDRVGGGRSKDKDALDVVRLLQAVETRDLARRFGTLRSDPRCRDVTEAALERLPELFGRRQSTGSLMAARAASVLQPGDEIAASAAVLTSDLLAALKEV